MELQQTMMKGRGRIEKASDNIRADYVSEDGDPAKLNPFGYEKPRKRVLGTLCTEEDLEQASTDLSKMKLGDKVALLRTDETWRYAKVLPQQYWIEIETTLQAGSPQLNKKQFLGKSHNIKVLNFTRNFKNNGSKWERIVGTNCSKRDIRKGVPNVEPSTLQPGEIVAVNRSGGYWSYGAVSKDILTLTFLVDEEGSSKDIVNRSWVKTLRPLPPEDEDQWRPGYMVTTTWAPKPKQRFFRPNLAQVPLSVMSISAAVSMGLLIGSGFTLAVLSFYRRPLAAS